MCVHTQREICVCVYIYICIYIYTYIYVCVCVYHCINTEMIILIELGVFRFFFLVVELSCCFYSEYELLI